MKIKQQYLGIVVGFKGCGGKTLGELNSAQLKTLNDIAVASKDKSLFDLFEKPPVDNKETEVLKKLNNINAKSKSNKKD